MVNVDDQRLINTVDQAGILDTRSKDCLVRILSNAQQVKVLTRLLLQGLLTVGTTSEDLKYILDVETNSSRSARQIVIDIMQGCIDKNYDLLADGILDEFGELYGKEEEREVRNALTQDIARPAKGA